MPAVEVSDALGEQAEDSRLNHLRPSKSLIITILF